DVEPTDERVRRIFRRYVELLPDSIEETSGYTIHPGVEELVDDLYRFHGDSLALGLGTGNIERGARLKLDPGDLNPYFDFGGFGSDAVERSELIRAGARRGSDHVDCPFADCRVVVIGDTPLDVRAARAIDAEALTVGTGGATEEELHASDPDYHFETLAEPDVRRVILDS
ncbi:MAG: HAD hydrolase-like protein, partial [Bradymonadaceae bacterium]